MPPEDNPADDVQPTKEEWDIRYSPLGDARIPLCQICDGNQGVKRLADGRLVCADCWEEWLMGRFDQDPPEEHI